MPIPLMAPAQPLLGQGAALGVPPQPQGAPVGALEIEVNDATGEVKIRDRSAAPEQPRPASFDENLAERLDEAALGLLAEELLRGIEADERSRREMIEQYSRGMDLLGLRLDGDAAGFAAGQSGKTISKVRHPILLWACVRFQSGARNELLPAAGPVKARIDGEDDAAQQALARDFEQDFNHYLTVTASEYYPDTDRGLFYLGYGGTLFKKVYHCPLRERPVSECVYMPDLIVSNDATDLMNAQRVTHRFEMGQEVLERLQETGFYRAIPLPPPSEAPLDPARQKEAQIAGIAAQREQLEDRQHTIYECYTAIDPSRYGLPESGGEAGRTRPYRISIDRDSRKVLEIRRNWRKDDPRCKPRKRFVKYGLIPGFGFYDYGFLHLIGNHTKALTALWRLVIDAGMFSTFPGGLRLKGSRTSTNEFRPGPGEFPEIDAAGVEDIRKLIMAMPYKEPSGVILEMIRLLTKDAAQIAGTVELELGEGRTNMPVGTILSMIEQQTQVMSAVHKRNHASQQEELLLLKELFAEDPSALCRFQQNPARNWQAAAEFADLALVPASDPNVPAQVHRIMQSSVLWMMATAAPQLFNQQEVVRRILRTVNIGDGESLLSGAASAVPPAPADPKSATLAAELPLKQQKITLAQQELALRQAESRREAAAEVLEAQQRQQDRALKAEIEAAKLAHARAKLAAQADAGLPAGGGAPSDPRRRQEGGAAPDRSSQAGASPDGNSQGAGMATSSTESTGAAPFAAYDHADGYAHPSPIDTLRFPDGTPVINPLTGQPLVMPAGVSMQDNLAIGQAIKDRYDRAMDSVDPMAGEGYLANQLAAELVRGKQMIELVSEGKPMDYQRRGGGFDATFRPFSSYNYGALARSAGYSLDEALMAAGLYNRMVTTGRRDGIYGNDPDNAQLIEAGWRQQPLFAAKGQGRPGR
jgi:hypothetical protein